MGKKVIRASDREEERKREEKKKKEEGRRKKKMRRKTRDGIILYGLFVWNTCMEPICMKYLVWNSC